MVDLGYLHPESLKRDGTRLLNDIMSKDVLELNNAFAELLHLVRMQTSKGFKALCSLISNHLFKFLEQDLDRYISGDVIAAKRLVQLFSYTSRLTLHDIDLTQQCLDDYISVENQIDDYLPKNLVASLRKIIEEWMEPFDSTRLAFKHGPRGVAGHGRTSFENKYLDLTFDDRLVYAYRDKTYVKEGIRSTLDRISHTIFVPKSYKTFRTISMEPTTLMYYQQGVLGEIDRVINADRRLRDRLGLHYQERNQILARQGSIARDYATIDLSAASDSVSYNLVKALFSRTKLWRHIFATRSTRTWLPDGRVIELKKFAPMGSALCFPIETIIFGAICHYVTREHYVTGRYSVFGDDIIVPTQCVADTMLILTTLGFKVNREKSFYQPDCWFRESCGGEYCDGYDVSPMRISRKYNHRQDDVKATGLIDLANESYKRGFRNLRQFFLNKLRSIRYGKKQWEFVPRFSPISLMSDNYTNYHTERRWNHQLQRIECRATLVVTKYSKNDVADESIRYFHWLSSTSNRTSIGDGYQSEIRRPIVSLQSRWVEKPYELSDQQFINFFTQREG
jgi:hypothetical protein